MSKKATLTDITQPDLSSFEFDTWNGYPQTPKPVISTFRRLGSKFQYVQKLGQEANMSISTATMVHEQSDLRSVIDILTRRIGNYFELSYFGKTFRIILMDVDSNLRAVSGSTDFIAEFSLTYLVEDEL